MAKSRRSQDPFSVPISKEQRSAIGNWLGNELRNADMARQSNIVDVDYWWSLYEQARTRQAHTLPWPDAADLTSYIPCEKVDSIHARIMRTVWVTPLCTAEGWGKAADQAPFVEEFHQWKAEEERLQNVLDRVALNALVEPRCLVEVYESSERRTTRKQMTVKPTMTPAGGIVFGQDGQPDIQPDAQTGEYQPAAPTDMGVNAVVDSQEVVRTGPQYRVLPYEDSLILPGHARDKEEIWGYAKRFWKRKIDLLADADRGIYDADAVESLTDVGDRQPTPSMMRSRTTVAPQNDRETAEKELWEGLILLNVNDLLDSRGKDTIKGSEYDSARWYVITIHLLTNTVIRMQHDDFEKSRYIPFILFPRSNRATEGYSLVGHKLLTVTEEHTAYRNMAADRSSLAVNAPIKKVSGALWDEDEQPWGPKAVITVRDHREIEQQQVTDVPQSVFVHITNCERTSDRLGGVNDIAQGQTIQRGDPTLGEVQMATEQSFVRMDLIVRRFQESLEDLYQIRHAIWKRCLAEQPYGIDASASMIVGLEGRGVPIDQYLPQGKVTAALLDGAFRFRPYGSVETADPVKRRADLIGFLSILPRAVQVFPSLATQFQNPAAARAFFRELLQAFHVHNTQVFLGSPAADLAQQVALEAIPMPSLAPPMGMGPAMHSPAPQMPPGAPPGLPGAFGAPSGPPGMPPQAPPMPPLPMAPGPIGLQ